MITGSSAGIGFSLAQGLATACAEIVLNGRDAEKLATAAGLLSAAGTPPQTLLLDTMRCRSRGRRGIGGAACAARGWINADTFGAISAGLALLLSRYSDAD